MRQPSIIEYSTIQVQRCFLHTGGSAVKRSPLFYAILQSPSLQFRQIIVIKYKIIAQKVVTYYKKPYLCIRKIKQTTSKNRRQRISGTKIMKTTNIKQFEIGKSYSVHSVCNWDCVWIFKVISRTASTITLKDSKGENKTCRINKKLTVSSNVESVMPMGNYSFAPVLRADNI